MKSMRILSAITMLLGSALAQTLLITNVTVVDATGAPPKTGISVLVRAGKIAAIGQHIKVAKNTTHVDGSGKFLIPGLWDMHTHVAGISADPKWGKHLLPVYLAHGIVGIRDMAGDLDKLLEWKQEQAAGRLAGPEMIVSGPFLDGSAKGFSLPGDVIEVTTADVARSKVRELRSRGADFIKVGSQLTPEVFDAIAAECRAQGISFAGHVPDAVTVEHATSAGMVSMEHMFGMLWATSGKAAELRQRAEAAQAAKDRDALARLQDELEASYSAEKTRQLAAAFKQNGTWLVPTLVWTQIASQMDKVEPSPMLAMFPAKLQSDWAPEKARTIFSSRGITFYTRKLKNDLRLVKALRDLGVPVLAGSDSLDPYVFPGDSVWRELDMLQLAGLTPMQALQAATRDAAAFLGREKQAGTIAVGKAADLVLLDRDPLDQKAGRPQIVGVFQRGKHYSRAELQQIVEAAAKAMQAE